MVVFLDSLFFGGLNLELVMNVLKVFFGIGNGF